MRPCLNQDILFQIGKKLIEEGKHEDVFKFAFSGIQPLQAMKRIFSSVTTLKLYTKNYEIGWSEKCYKFELESDKPHCKYLMHQIGSCVKNLRINCKVSYLRQMYQPIIDKIVAKKQLIDFSVGPLCTKSFMDQFLPVFSTSLKHVTIPNKLLTPTFRDTMKLESLTIINPDDYNFAMFCCKTSSLKFMQISDSPNIPYNLVSPNMRFGSLSPALSSVKELIIDNSIKYFDFHQFQNVINFFPSLEAIIYIITPKYKDVLIHHYVDFANRIRRLKRGFYHAINVPPKITFLFTKQLRKTYYFRLFSLYLYEDFDHVESVEEFYCFRKTILSGDNESILLEIQLYEYSP